MIGRTLRLKLKQREEYFDKFYPSRKHFHGKYGWYYKFAEEKESSPDLARYSGSGCIFSCDSCKEREYFPPLEESIYRSFEELYICPKCARKKAINTKETNFT